MGAICQRVSADLSKIVRTEVAGGEPGSLGSHPYSDLSASARSHPVFLEATMIHEDLSSLKTSISSSVKWGMVTAASLVLF